MMQPTVPPVGPPKRNLSETVWTKLDRKATAIAEFTMRQYRKKRSTWSVGAVGLVLVVIVLLFYIDAMSAGIDSWDNDGDGLIDEDPSDWMALKRRASAMWMMMVIVGPENPLIVIGMAMVSIAM